MKLPFRAFRRSPAQVAAFFVCIVVGSCGRGDRSETAYVRGTVTLDGATFTEGGSVFFQPEPKGKMATGQIREDGSYELTTYSLGDGAIVGPNRVTILPLPPEIVDDFAAESAKGKPSSIPQKYGSPLTSGLVYEVKPGEQNEFQIELKRN